MSKTITVIIDDDGNATIETHGYTGSSCADATRALEAALGGEIQKIERKPEYYEKLPPTHLTNEIH